MEILNSWRNGNSLERIPDHTPIFEIIENYCKREEVKKEYGNRVNVTTKVINECFKNMKCNYVGDLKQLRKLELNLFNKQRKALFRDKAQLAEDMLRFYGFIE